MLVMTRHPLWWAASQCRNPYNCQPKERGSCPRELQLKLHPVTCVWRPPTPTDTYTSLVHVWAEWNGAYMSEHVRHARICGRFQTALVRTEVSVVLYIVLYTALLHRELLHILILYCLLHCFILYSVRGGVELRWALSYLTFQMYMTSDRLKLVKRRCTMDHCDITGNEDSASKTASYHVSFAPRRVVRQLADWLTLR